MAFKKLKKFIKGRKTKKAQTRLKKVGVKVTKKQAALSGKVRKKGLTGAKVTKKAGAYATYKKKSKAAGSFRAAFKKAGGKNFTWDGRKYSGKKAAPKAKKKK